MNEPSEAPRISNSRTRTCWIHIGMHKTGSTSIQENLAGIRDPQGWKYVTVVDGSNMGQALHSMFATDPHEFHWFKKQGKSAEQVAKRGARLRRRLTRAIERSGDSDVIMSAEALSLMDKRGVVALKEFLTPWFGSIKIAAYVRPPEGFMSSAYQQQLKHGKKRFHFGGVRPKYRRRFQKFDQVFGRRNVVLRKFDPASFPNGCIVADFCRMVGIQPPPEGSVKRVNESLCREACGILFAYRKFGSEFGVGRTVVRENNWIMAPLLAMKGRKFVVARELLGKSMRRKDIRWMERRLGENLEESANQGPDVVSSEEDLLFISRGSCQDFADRFREIHKIRVSRWRIPKGDPVDPRKVAELLDYCRRLARNRILAGEENTASWAGLWKSRIMRFPPARMSIRWLEKHLAAFRGGEPKASEDEPDDRSAR